MNRAGADLSDCSFWWIDLEGANLQGTNFAGADVRWVDFDGANLAGADFTGARLAGADFRDADLTGAIFDNATLHWVTFQRSFGGDVSIANANLYRANFTDSTIAPLNPGQGLFNETTCPDGTQQDDPCW